MPVYTRKHDKDVKVDAVRRDGGLAVSFINTTAGGQRPLTDYADLLAWIRQQQVMAQTHVDHLAELAAEHPEQADAAFAGATELHGQLSAIFHALADREDPPPSAIQGLESYLNRRPPRRLGADQGGYLLTWDDDDLLWPLLGVMTSAVNVLVSKKLCGRVGRCAREGCGVLFVARHGGRPRKWCDMKTCGNRVKSLRRYHTTVKPRQAGIRKRTEERLQLMAEDPERWVRETDERIQRAKSGKT